MPAFSLCAADVPKRPAELCVMLANYGGDIPLRRLLRIRWSRRSLNLSCQRMREAMGYRVLDTGLTVNGFHAFDYYFESVERSAFVVPEIIWAICARASRQR